MNNSVNYSVTSANAMQTVSELEFTAKVSVIALQTLQLDSRGEKLVALERLTAALNLAEPGGIIRLFVDFGSQMADLLKQLIKHNVAVEYIKLILDAFKEDEHRAVFLQFNPANQSAALATITTFFPFFIFRATFC